MPLWAAYLDHTLIAILAFRWLSHWSLGDYRGLQLQTQPRDNDLVRSLLLTLSTRSKHGGPSATPRKSKGKQSALSFEESNVEHSSRLKEILAEPKGVYRHTRIWTGAIAPIEYKNLAKAIESNDEHSAITESHSSNSYMEEVFAYIASTLEEIVRRFEEQSRV